MAWNLSFGRLTMHWLAAVLLRGLAVTGLALGVVAMPAAHAQGDAQGSLNQVPWTRAPVSVAVQQAPLYEVLRQLFAQQNVPAAISPRLRDPVSGNFKGDARSTFAELASVYGFMWWFDGATVHVSAATERTSKLISVPPANLPAVKRALADIKLDRAGFPIRVNDRDGYLSVTGPPRFVKAVEDAAQFGASAQAEKPKTPGGPNAPLEVKVFRLRHAWARDIVLRPRDQDGGQADAAVLPGMLSILRDILVGGDQAARSRQRNESRVLARPGSSGDGYGSQASMSAVAGQSAPRYDAQGRLIPDANRSSVLEPRATESPLDPIPLDSGGSIAADVRLNAIIVRDTADKMRYYEQLIKDLDVSTHLVEIEATVIDLDERASAQLGVEFGLANNKLNVSGPANANQAAGFSISTLIGGNRFQFLARVNALAADGQARLLSRPKVLTLVNTEAVLSNSTNFFVRVAGRDVANLYNVRTGLTLRVTPHVLTEKERERIRLLVLVEDGSPESAARVDEIPVVNRNFISTQAVINEGESLLVGGYTLQQSSQNESKVPLLGDLPLVGGLFRQTQNSSRKMERLFMITPRIVQPDEL